MPSHTFKRQERLKSRKIIQSLFREGQAVSAFPLRLIWLRTSLPSSTYPAQFTLTVPKRSFPKATDRNLLRRQIRESYRLRKHVFYEKISNSDVQVAVLAIYVGKEPLPYKVIDKAMRKALTRLSKKVIEAKA
jgi:ribonuclease P protein component